MEIKENRSIQYIRWCKKVKNNSKVTLSIKGTGTGLYAYFKNAKTGVVQRLELGYGRGGFKTGENIYD